jgi:predicted nucleic acid-binding protein
MVVIDASALVDARVVNGATRSLLAAESLQAPPGAGRAAAGAPLLTSDARLTRAPGLRCCVELIEP